MIEIIREPLLMRIIDYHTQLMNAGISEIDIPPFRVSWKEIFQINIYFLQNGAGQFGILKSYHGVPIEVIE